MKNMVRILIFVQSLPVPEYGTIVKCLLTTYLMVGFY